MNLERLFLEKQEKVLLDIKKVNKHLNKLNQVYNILGRDKKSSVSFFDRLINHKNDRLYYVFRYIVEDKDYKLFEKVVDLSTEIGDIMDEDKKMENITKSPYVNNFLKKARINKMSSLKKELNTCIIECIEIFKKHYSDINNIKKILKNRLFILKKSCSNIKSNQKINKSEILELFITDLSFDEISELENNIDEYNSLIDKKHIEKSTSKNDAHPKTEEPKKEEKKHYVDFTLEEKIEKEDKTDNIEESAKMYLSSIESMDNILSIKVFIDSIMHNTNFSKILDCMLELAKEKDLKKEIINLLNQYKIKNDKKTIDIVDAMEEFKETSSKMQRRIYFHGFIDDGNYDLLDLPKEYYKKVYEAYRQLKCSVDTGIKPIQDVTKLFEKKYKDIRIYFYQLPNNIFVIMGIEKKVQSVSNYIRRVVVERLKTPLGDRSDKKMYSEFERVLKAQTNIDEFLKEYDEKAEMMEKEFIEKLNIRIK